MQAKIFLSNVSNCHSMTCALSGLESMWPNHTSLYNVQPRPKWQELREESKPWTAPISTKHLSRSYSYLQNQYQYNEFVTPSNLVLRATLAAETTGFTGLPFPSTLSSASVAEDSKCRLLHPSRVAISVSSTVLLSLSNSSLSGLLARMCQSIIITLSHFISQQWSVLWVASHLHA